MGSIFRGLENDREGRLGTIQVGEDGRGEMVGEIQWPIWEVVGRGVVVEREEGAVNGATGADGAKEVNGAVNGGEGDIGMKGDSLVVGVIARSAGVWENEKVVCGCSGKTVWEERGEAVKRGIL